MAQSCTQAGPDQIISRVRSEGRESAVQMQWEGWLAKIVCRDDLQKRLALEEWGVAEQPWDSAVSVSFLYT